MAGRRRGFDRRLDAIDAKVIELFEMVCEDLPAVTQAVLHGTSEVAGPLAERDRAIDALYREVEQLVSREILLQAPVASDLRFLLSVLRIAPELERSHDLVCHIASRAGHVPGSELSPRCRGLIERWTGLPAACGAGPRTVGASGMGPPRRRWPRPMMSWMSCTRAWWLNWLRARWRCRSRWR
jgi:hypothetical protein